MARARRSGESRGRVERDGPAGAGTGPSGAQRRQGKSVTGQQSGSNRPAVKTGAAKKAPKKRDVPPKGVKQPGMSRKTGTRKDMGARKAAGGRGARRGGDARGR